MSNYNVLEQSDRFDNAWFLIVNKLELILFRESTLKG